MTTLDLVVLFGYFLLMTLIGVLSMLRVKKQEDYFLGSRGFGKILQAFAAFGAGTGSNDPVTVGRTTFTSGLSGIWSVLLWLFVTPFYWIAGVWYRRMRHITLGDWFVERYQSKPMGVAYMLFGIAFYMVYLGVGFSSIGKVAAPLIQVEQVTVPLIGMTIGTAELLVIITAGIVLLYGVLGGLKAAYWTDLIQGIFIILLSVLLIPVGLKALVEEASVENEQRLAALDDSASEAERQELTEQAEQLKEHGILSGFNVMHDRVPDEYFKIVESPRGGEFPLHYILAISLLNLIGIVVQPHFIATGGGSAKSETSARIGLVSGNFMKRFCTVGWALTALIILALMADSVEIAEDPDRVWGVAARELLGPLNLGLVGLMLACLMAALMSSASCYMLVTSGLVVRNGYAAYINPNASERTYVLAGRLCGAAVIVGAALVSVRDMDVFGQLKTAWELPILFAATFWVGMFWRRATAGAAWLTTIFTLAAFFVVPAILPMVMPGLSEDARFTTTNDIVTTTVTREAVRSDVERRQADIAIWEEQRDAVIAEQGKEINGDDAKLQAAIEALGPAPVGMQLGEQIQQRYVTGGKSIYWKKGVSPIDDNGAGPALEVVERTDVDENTVVIRQRYDSDAKLQGAGNFQLDFLLYDALGVPLTQMDNAALETLRLPTRLFLPFVVMVLSSLITPRVNKESLDRFYVKMKTPVEPDPEADQREMALSYEDPSRFDDRRLIKAFGLECQRPTFLDIAGFIASFVCCFLIIWLIVWLANFQIG